MNTNWNGTMGRIFLGAGTLAGTCLMAVAADAQTPATPVDPAANPTGWKSSAALGATITRGNSETVTVNGTVLSEKKWNKNELSLGAGFTYGEDEDKVNASTVNGFVQYNRLMSERFYIYGRVDALHDDVAHLTYRVTLSPGAGYYFIKNDKITLSGEAGPGIAFEKFWSEDEKSYWTLRFGQKFTWKITDHSRFWEMLDYSPKVDDWADYALAAEVGIETDITKHLALRLVAQDNYRSKPATGRKENDFRLMAGVAYKF